MIFRHKCRDMGKQVSKAMPCNIYSWAFWFDKSVFFPNSCSSSQKITKNVQLLQYLCKLYGIKCRNCWSNFGKNLNNNGLYTCSTVAIRLISTINNRSGDSKTFESRMHTQYKFTTILFFSSIGNWKTPIL